MAPSDGKTSSHFPRSPFNDVFALITQGNEKALKQAFYNTIAIVFIFFVLFSGIAVYLVLQPFLQPLLWATLIGSVLHPFKRKLTKFSRWWIADEEKRPISFSVIKMPLTLANYVVNSLVTIVHQYYKLLLFIFIAFLSTHLALFYFPVTTKLFALFGTLVFFLNDIVKSIVNLCNFAILSTMITSQIILYVLTPSSIANRIANFTLPVTLLLLILKILQIVGTTGVLIGFIMTVITLTGIIASYSGFVSIQSDEADSQSLKGRAALLPFIWSFLMSLLPSTTDPSMSQSSLSPQSIGDDACSPSSSPQSENVKRIDSIDGKQHLSDQDITMKVPLRPRHPKRPANDSKSSNTSSTTYIYAVFWSCLLAQLWLRPHILWLIPVIASLFLLTWIWRWINGKQIIEKWVNTTKELISERMASFHHSLIEKFYFYYMVGDDIIANLLLKSLDGICSLFTICSMIIIVIIATTFFSIQIYQESAHLIELTGSMVNSTLVLNPQLANAFPAGIFGQSLVDEMINNAYVYGRQWLQKSIRSALNVGTDAMNATSSVEKQLLEVWDRVYHQWLIRNSNSTYYEINNRSFEAYNWNRLFAALQTLDFALCFNLLKGNFDTVLSIFDSVWILLKSNLTLLFTLTTATISLLLSGSSAILNCCLNLIIFATSLFYLLCSSGDEYKPVELVGRFLPDSDRKSNYLNKFGQAVEESVNSVFAASFKMTVFYGLYTWLVHTLFEVRIIYIPSVLAALLGAVPFIGAYWASIPAVLELYLVHDLGLRSFLMGFFAFLPSYFVDSAIYSDIKGGGHPYLTGLAIAGGVFYLGFSGAFFGPMILCCLFVAGKLYTSIMIDGPAKESGMSFRNFRPHLKRMNTSTDL